MCLAVFEEVEVVVVCALELFLPFEIIFLSFPVKSRGTACPTQDSNLDTALFSAAPRISHGCVFLFRQPGTYTFFTRAAEPPTRLFQQTLEIAFRSWPALCSSTSSVVAVPLLPAPNSLLGVQSEANHLEATHRAFTATSLVVLQ